MNTLSSPTRSMNPAVARISRISNLTRARAKTMPRSASVLRTSSRASTAVRSTSVFASAVSRHHSTGELGRALELDRGKGENDATFGQRLAHLLEGVDRCQIDFSVRFGVKQEPLDRRARQSSRT